MNKKELKQTKQFCMAPWTHLHILPNKDVILCCLSPIEQVLGNLGNQTMAEIWNGEPLKEIRRNMLAGVDSTAHCYRCYEKDEQGFLSLRSHMNNRYLDDHWNQVESTEADGTVPELNLIHWDFRFSNICTQSCRTCGPGFSSKWANDNNTLYDIPTKDQAPKVQKIYDDLDTFEREFDELFKKVEYIHFAGGEPLVHDEHYMILEKLIELTRTDIKIRYSTNFNTLIYKRYDVLELWKNFSNIEVIASIDDICDRYDFLRNGGNWGTVVNNVKRMKEEKLLNRRIQFGVHPTIAFWNIYYLPELYYGCEDAGMFDGKLPEQQVFHINPLTYPAIYSSQILPAEYKKKVTDKLLEFAKFADITERLYSDIVSLLDFMNADDLSHLLPETKDMTDRLDKIRNQDFSKTFLFLKDLFNNV